MALALLDDVGVLKTDVAELKTDMAEVRTEVGALHTGQKRILEMLTAFVSTGRPKQ